MKKRIAPILVVLALVVVGGLGYFMGQRSNEPTIESPPAESSTPEVTPEVEPVSSEPVVEPTPETVSPEPSVEPTLEQDEEEMVFRDTLYQCIVMAEKMPAYSTPHTTLPPVREYVRWDKILYNVSESGEWCRTEVNGEYIYFREADITGGLTDKQIDELFIQRDAEQQSPKEEQQHQQEPAQPQQQPQSPKEEPIQEDPKPSEDVNDTPPEDNTETPETTDDSTSSGDGYYDPWAEAGIPDQDSGIEGGWVGNGPGDGITIHG